MQNQHAFKIPTSATEKHKKNKRGKKKSNTNLNKTKLEIYYNNINGLTSKQDSLKHILELNQPDLIALCETKLHAKSTFSIEGYQVIKSNMKTGKEGILVAAKLGTFQSMELLFENDSKQIATVEITYPKEQLRVIVVHGPQEDASVEEKEEFYVDLKAEIQRCVDSGNPNILVIGDLNAKLEHEKGMLLESKGNGKRLKETIDEYDLKVLNIQPDAEGKWTRIQRKGETISKSVIDYIISSPAISQRTRKVAVDEDKMYTPYRTRKQGNNQSIVFSDHCAILASIDIEKGNKANNQPKQKFKRWILTKEGLEKYAEMTQHELGFGDLSKYSDPFDTWRKKVDAIMHECFEKRTINIGGGNKNTKEKMSTTGVKLRSILKEIGKKGKIQREITKIYQQRLITNEAKISNKVRASKISKTVETLTDEDKLSPNAFWKMRKSTNKNNQLKLPEVYKKNGTTTSEPTEIKNEVQNEFKYRLRNRDPEEGWEGYVETTNSVVEELLRNDDDQSPPFDMEELKDAMRKLKDGISPDVFDTHTEILNRSGNGVLTPLLQVLNLIKAKKQLSDSWRRVLITMIYKNKGSHKDLEKYRGIFLTVIVSKIFERMLQGRMKTPLERVSFFQAGARTGKSGADNLFLLRSSIDHTKYMNDSLYVTTYDFRQAFDSLWLQDCLLVLRKLGVETYILKLIHEMNKRAIVQIKTPYGLTEPVDVTDIVKQGGVLGSPICSATTAEYCEQNKGIRLGQVSIASLAFVDDIADLSTSFEDAIASHKKALTFAQRKKLELAPEKCYIMLIQPRNKTNLIPDLEVNGAPVSKVDSIVYLGDVFNSKGNNDDLMNDRVRRGTATTVSIHGFMRETSLGSHTLSVFILLHNAILLPSMLFNSQAWSGITHKNVSSITKIQLRFLKKMMGTRQATANAFVYLELGVLPIKHEIHKRQLMFLYHIVHLSEDDPVKKVWRNQMSLPEHSNWWRDVEKLLDRYRMDFDEQTIATTSKETYKKRVKMAVANQAFHELQCENQERKRTCKLNYEKLETRKYIKQLDTASARTIFKCRAKTLSIKEHMEYKFTDLSCRWCGISEERLEHIVNCGQDSKINNVEEVLEEMKMDKLKEVASRVQDFLWRVDE